MKKNVQLENENKSINNLVKKIQDHLKEEIIKRDELEAYGRRTCVELVGIPSTENEDCQQLAMALAKVMKLDVFSIDEIDVAHRVSPKINANVIVKFKSRTVRDFYFQSRKQLKGKTVHNMYQEWLTITSENENMLEEDKDNPFFENPGNIFVNESLTPSKKNLFWKTRTKAKELGWTGFDKNGRCWTKNGTIFIQQSKEGGTPVIKYDMTLIWKKFNQNSVFELCVYLLYAVSIFYSVLGKWFITIVYTILNPRYV